MTHSWRVRQVQLRPPTTTEAYMDEPGARRGAKVSENTR